MSTRKVTVDQCTQFMNEGAAIRDQIFRFMSTFDDFKRNEWTGGDIKSPGDQNCAPPARCAKAMGFVQDAVKAMQAADHEIAMFQAMEASDD